MTQGNQPTGQPSREERLAEQLRANLRRRKAQARELRQPGKDAPQDPDRLAQEDTPG